MKGLLVNLLKHWGQKVVGVYSSLVHLSTTFICLALMKLLCPHKEMYALRGCVPLFFDQTIAVPHAAGLFMSG